MIKVILLISIYFITFNNLFAETKKAYFAGGCFWCMEESFDQINGVLSSTSGYSGGHLKNPKYEDVIYTDSGHVETIEITYDSSITNYKNLLQVYWKNISGEFFKNYKINKISRSKDNVRIRIGNEYLDYDHVVLASHADQSLKMLENPTEDELRILSKFKYVSNTAILHTDKKLMPKKKLAWSSWNSISKGSKTCVTYWLNNLQNLGCEDNFFLTLNPIYEIDKANIIKKIDFSHPYFNRETLKLQNSLQSLQGKNRTWYCGAYFSYGFHEDGLKSSINLVNNFKA